MRLRCIACAVFERELRHCATQVDAEVVIDILPQGLHNQGGRAMAAAIQAAIDAVPADDCDAILLAYGLCNNGIVGLRHPTLPIVVPRAHDCITCFLGSRTRYQDEFAAEPGTYWLTAGWLDHGTGLGGGDANGGLGDWDELVATYGEDNARYLVEAMQGNDHYRRCVYIDTGVTVDDQHEAQARRRAADRGWRFERLLGDLSLLRRMLTGNWDADLLVVPPGCDIVASHGDDIVAAVPGGQ